jgi:hypothetical protein
MNSASKDQACPARPNSWTPAALPGRAGILGELARLLDGGHTVLLYGPVGVGKSSVIRWLDARAEARGVPRGLALATETLGDLTTALTRAYPDVDVGSVTKRQARSRLRNAVEQRPGVLLLDHLGETGRAFKGALRSLRGMGAGVLLAADVDQPRDHERARQLHLAQYEVELPPLHGSTMRALMRSMLATADLPFHLLAEDVSALVTAAEGLPGRSAWIVETLHDSGAWRSGRPRCDWLRIEATIAAAERYRRPR